MKNIFLISMLFSLTLFSCKPKKIKPMQYRLVGKIFNANDSLPFSNTQFKVYSYTPYNGVTPAKTEEQFFTTDDNGAFDLNSSFTGILVWPSYIDGSAYIGPPYFGNSKSGETNYELRISTSYFDTLYTTPYH